MVVDKVVPDEEFGHIYIKCNARAKRYTFRPAKDGTPEIGLLVTVPTRYVLADVLRSVEGMRPKLRQLMAGQATQGSPAGHIPHIDWNFRITSDCLHIELVKGNREGFYVRHEPAEVRLEASGDEVIQKPGLMQIICPADCDFDAPRRQEWLAKVIEEGVRKHARYQLCTRMVGYAAHYGIELHDVKINSSKGRWGSCSRHGHQAQLAGRGQEYFNINLSLYTLLLPLPVQRLVMLHELTHTRHMDHSAAFHHDLDEWLDGKEEALEQELKRYTTSIFSFTTVR